MWPKKSRTYSSGKTCTSDLQIFLPPCDHVRIKRDISISPPLFNTCPPPYRILPFPDLSNDFAFPHRNPSSFLQILLGSTPGRSPLPHIRGHRKNDDGGDRRRRHLRIRRVDQLHRESPRRREKEQSSRRQAILFSCLWVNKLCHRNKFLRPFI